MTNQTVLPTVTTQAVDQSSASMLSGTNGVSEVASNALNNVVSQSSDSIFSYFWNAGWLIKSVIITLLFASIYSWSFMFSHNMKLRRLNRDADDFEEAFWSGEPLDVLYNQVRNSANDPMTNVFCAAMSEWEQAMNSKSINPEPIAVRIEKAMSVAINREISELSNGMPVLSSIGTNGVIIGLFGTVIGILNGFKAISVQQSVSIGTIGPIITEALITTAFGIITAIPAAFGYNKIHGNIDRYINRLEVFAEEFSLIIARQIGSNSE